jgi:hypothetical protein
LVADENGRWAFNCFICHGGKVAGQVVPGLGNAHVAMQTLQDDVTMLRTRQGRLDEMVDSGMPGVPLGGSVGTTNAVVFGLALGARRNLQLNYQPNNPVPQFLHHDHDAPPWWQVKRKKMLYIDGYAPKAHRALMPFLMLPQNDAEKFTEWEDDFKDILAWIESIEPPKYPWTVDQRLAEQGKVAFERTCAECHGTYGAGGEYPELNVELEVVGTDPARYQAFPPLARMFHQISWFGEHGKHKTIARPPGYVAPPLDGVWASAPYLHNGSVPTLWHLFHADQRPLIWKRSEDGYDQKRVGLEFEQVTEIPTSAVAPAPKAGILRHPRLQQEQSRTPLPRRVVRRGKDGRHRVPEDAVTSDQPLGNGSAPAISARRNLEVVPGFFLAFSFFDA